MVRECRWRASLSWAGGEHRTESFLGPWDVAPEAPCLTPPLTFLAPLAHVCSCSRTGGDKGKQQQGGCKKRGGGKSSHSLGHRLPTAPWDHTWQGGARDRYGL